jgi:Zn-dependent peptidase ImmA (M78 family)
MPHRYDPFTHAEMLGISVRFGQLRTANGLWLPEHRSIIIKEGMRAVHTRVALTHEIGHADLGHEDDRPKHEKQADRYAASRLVDRVRFEELTAWTNDAFRIAHELGVTQRILTAYVERQYA